MTASNRRSFRHRLAGRSRVGLGDILRMETVGGALLLVGAVVGLLWINSPWGDAYEAFRAFTIGPETLHLDLSIGTWAADGLLAIFFFVVGLELKRELVVGELSNPSEALLPIIAAVCGVAIPAALFVLVNLTDPEALRGWAIPAATDIAFALAVLAVVGRHLPGALRAFLLTLAIVDDLVAILIIALFYTAGIELWALGAAALGVVVFFLLQRANFHGWYLYLPLALVIWVLVHEGGVHATIAGVAMAMCVRVRTRPNETTSPAEHLEHLVRPVSAGVALPIFAFTSAGVDVMDIGIGGLVEDTAALGVIAGLVLGKIIGIFGGSLVAVRVTRATLSSEVGWTDMLGLSMLAGIGFTVSLLITELAFGEMPERLDHVKAGVLAASLLASLLAIVMLQFRNRHYRQLAEAQNVDRDREQAPEVIEDEEGHGGSER